MKMLLILLVGVILTSPATSIQLSAVWNEKISSYDLVKGRANDYVSMIDFKNDINQTGWAYLEIKTNENKDDLDQAYTAGLLEGLVTSDLIKMHWTNTYKGYCTKPLSAYCKRLQDYMDKNWVWMQDQIAQNAKTDPYWYQMSLYLQQLQGLIDGYAYKQSPRPLLTKFKPDITGVLLIELSGDLGDLEQALQFDGEKPVVGTGSCSALVKLLPGNKDLYVSQDTWNTYGSMLRVLKRYNFGFHMLPGSRQVVPGRDMTFSSYPALLMSGDDFYTISSGLLSQETTIGNANASLWSKVTPVGTVLELMRTMVANRLAKTGKDWVETFSKYNSGTYNNQWMVVDFNKFTSGMATLPDGLLYVLEQIPGKIMYDDMTSVLRNQSYWPSYNVAYFPDIFNESGGQEMVAKYGDWFSYDHTPRANIFRRDHKTVTDVQSMMRLMRYNDYTHDPLSKCNCTPPYSAENAISARCDLNPANGTYPFGALGHRVHGGIDMKLTTSSMMKSLEFWSISGPTYDSLPPFDWSKSDFKDSVSHVGHPNVWQFKPIQHNWKL